MDLLYEQGPSAEWPLSVFITDNFMSKQHFLLEFYLIFTIGGSQPGSQDPPVGFQKYLEGHIIIKGMR